MSAICCGFCDGMRGAIIAIMIAANVGYIGGFGDGTAFALGKDCALSQACPENCPWQGNRRCTVAVAHVGLLYGTTCPVGCGACDATKDKCPGTTNAVLKPAVLMPCKCATGCP
jgi:hypothetical protein